MLGTTSCIVAGAFIISSIFLCLRVDKQTLKDPLFQLLSDENKQRYIDIANERKNIYFKGFGLGFIILGVGGLNPNISTMVGGLYNKDDDRRDIGFKVID